MSVAYLTDHNGPGNWDRGPDLELARERSYWVRRREALLIQIYRVMSASTLGGRDAVLRRIDRLARLRHEYRNATRGQAITEIR